MEQKQVLKQENEGQQTNRQLQPNHLTQGLQSLNNITSSEYLESQEKDTKSNNRKLKQILLTSLLFLICLIGIVAIKKLASFQIQIKQKILQKIDIEDSEAVNFKPALQIIRWNGTYLTQKHIVNIPKYKKFNYNLAQYLLEKKNISHLMCLNCANQTLAYLESQKYYQKMTIMANQITSQNYWIHVPRNTKTIETIKGIQKLLKFIKKYDSENLKGFSVFWKQTWTYMNNADSLKQIPKLSAQIGYHYIEPVSLNLRYTEQGVIMLFEKKLPTYKPLPFTPPRKFISLQTKFRMIENLPFLRQYFLYHLKMGVSLFFIYDNDGSTKGHKQATDKTSKYSLNFSCIAPQERKIDMFNEIWEDFQEFIIYIPWQPVVKGAIAMLQFQATYNYINFYQDVTPWTAYIDFDQFIFSEKDLDLIDYVQSKEKEGVTYLTLQHYKLSSRFCADGQLVTQAYLAMDINHLKWAPKIIVMNSAIIKYTVHKVQTRFGTQLVIPAQEFKFYHYNLIESLFKWAWSQKSIKALNSNKTYIDDSMKKHVPMLKKYCNNQCSDNYKFLCPIEERHINNKCAELKDYTGAKLP